MLGNAPTRLIYQPLDIVSPMAPVAISTATQLQAWTLLRGYYALRWVIINDSGTETVQATLDTSEDPNPSKAVDQEHQWIIQIAPGLQGSIPLGPGGPNGVALLHTYFRFMAQTLSLVAANVRWTLLGAGRG